MVLALATKPLCAMPGCPRIASSKGKRGPHSPVIGIKRRFKWCYYHRRGRGKAERVQYAAFIEREKEVTA